MQNECNSTTSQLKYYQITSSYINKPYSINIKQSLQLETEQQWSLLLQFKHRVMIGSNLCLHNISFSMIPSLFNGPVFYWTPYYHYMSHICYITTNYCHVSLTLTAQCKKMDLQRQNVSRVLPMFLFVLLLHMQCTISKQKQHDLDKIKVHIVCSNGLLICVV